MHGINEERYFVRQNVRIPNGLSKYAAYAFFASCVLMGGAFLLAVSV